LGLKPTGLHCRTIHGLCAWLKKRKRSMFMRGGGAPVAACHGGKLGAGEIGSGGRILHTPR
jgi:hypothetical protein